MKDLLSRILFLTEAKSPQAVEAIIKKHGEKLAARIKSDNRSKDLSPEALILKLEEVDPTKKSIYVDWMIREYLAGRVRYIEDFGKLISPLKQFEALKPKLPVDERDIGQYRFDDLFDLVDKHADTDTRSNNQVEKDEEAQMYEEGEATLLRNDAEWKIVVPHVEEASVYFGRNTKWCTAGKDWNQFDNYNDQGPLYIVLHKPTNRRWQLHVASGQFMDEQDKPIPTQSDDLDAVTTLKLMALIPDEQIKDDVMARVLAAAGRGEDVTAMEGISPDDLTVNYPDVVLTTGIFGPEYQIKAASQCEEQSFYSIATPMDITIIVLLVEIACGRWRHLDIEMSQFKRQYGDDLQMTIDEFVGQFHPEEGSYTATEDFRNKVVETIINSNLVEDVGRCSGEDQVRLLGVSTSFYDQFWFAEDAAKCFMVGEGHYSISEVFDTSEYVDEALKAVVHDAYIAVPFAYQAGRYESRIIDHYDTEEEDDPFEAGMIKFLGAMIHANSDCEEYIFATGDYDHIEDEITAEVERLKAAAAPEAE